MGLEGRIWEARGDDSSGLVREDLGEGAVSCWKIFGISPPRVGGWIGALEKFSLRILVDVGCEEVDVDFLVELWFDEV